VSAPFFASLADGPDGGRAEWLTTSDGRRIRIGFWVPAGAKGTVFLLPGRTEYIEKYGRAAADLARRGFATLSVDWRGQGLSDRALDDPIPGHVVDFAEYQRDLQAMIAGARAQGLPEPYYLLAHSMGGCIALRGLMGAHPFQAAAFTAPMWSILIPAWQRPVAEVLSGLSTWMRFDHLYAPGTGPVIYTTAAPFVGNTLTTDPDMWAYMASHMRSEPGLALGGPTLGWLRMWLAI
jgi:lysophospholipase